MYRLTKICAWVPVNETCVTSVNRIISLLQINLHFHATVITILLFVGSAILLRSLRRFAKESRQNEDDKGLRQLTVASLFLSAILIACTLAHIITHSGFTQNWRHHNWQLQTKCYLLRLFIYAWRLPYYRKFLKLVFTRAGRQIGNEATETVTMAWLLLILTIII